MTRVAQRYRMFIDGVARDGRGGAEFEVANPADGTTLCRVSEGRVEDVHDAVAAAGAAFADRRWAGMRGRDRSRVLHRAAALLEHRIEELAQLESLQVGRPVREMTAQLRRVPEWFEYFGSVAQTFEGSLPDFGEQHLNYVIREPVGVAGLITPWNHPLLITMKKLAPALAAGNSVVIKPSELAPVTPLLLAQICHAAGVPDGVVNVVPGFGAIAGKALAEHPAIARLDMTGGTPTGRAVAAAAGHNLVPVTAELGGKAPVVVFDDVHTERAAAGAAFAAFIASGQTCVQGARLLIQRGLYESVLESLASRASSLRLGDPLDSSTQLGPLISAEARERIDQAVQTARTQGARVACGGRCPRGALGERGYFYEATVLADVTPDMAVWQDELFGPVTVAIPFRDEDDAVRLANDSAYGLAASIWTNDVARAHRVARRIQAGVIWVNDHHRIDPSSPWGGTKDSGIGRENGLDAYRSYTQTRSVIVNTSSDVFDWYASDEGLRYS